MARGYAEGPAADELMAAGDDMRPPAPPHAPLRRAVYGFTAEEPERHFLGWEGEVDPDELFARGAYGLSVVERAE